MLTFSGGLTCVATLPDLETYRQSGKGLSLHNNNLGGAYRHRNQKAMDQIGSTSRRFSEFINSKGINLMVSEVISLNQVPNALGSPKKTYGAKS
jgi:hypothetical protein